MKICILDWTTVTSGDIDYSVFREFGEVRCYPITDNAKAAECIADSDMVLCNKVMITQVDGLPGPVVVQMVLVHVGDHIDDGEQTEEGAVGLIGFGDEVVAAAQMGVGAVDIEPPPDDDRGVQTGRVEDGGRQGRGGGLAVRTGNGHALAQAHQLGQHLGTGDDGDIAAARFHHFGVVLGDGRGFDQHLHVAHVLGRMAHGDAGPKTAQMLDHGRIAHVRARDVIAQVEQDLGDAAHAGAADAHHVNLPNLAVHMSSLSIGKKMLS